MNNKIRNIIDPGAKGFFAGHAGGYYQNPYHKQSDDHQDYKNGWDAGRKYLAQQLNAARVSA